MKTILALVLAFFTVSAQAADLELGIGYNQYKQQANGIWYQEGFPYNLDLQSVSWSVGVSDKCSGLPRIRAEYLNLGMARSTAYAVPTDANYNPDSPNHCNGECQPLALFVGKGKVTGIALTVAPEINFGNVSLYVEGGFYFYRPTYRVVVTGIDSPQEPGGITHHFGHKTETEICYVFGAGARYKNVDLSIRYMEVKASGDDFPAIYNGTVNSSIKLNF